MLDNKHVSLVKAVTDRDLRAATDLLALGALANYSDSLPLRAACWLGYTELAKLLLESNASVHAGNEEPLFAAVRTRDLELIKLLREKGASLDTLTARRRNDLNDDDKRFVDNLLAREAKEAFEKTARDMRKKAPPPGRLLLHGGLKPGFAF